MLLPAGRSVPVYEETHLSHFYNKFSIDFHSNTVYRLQIHILSKKTTRSQKFILFHVLK